jgi:hypothetical protein
VKELWSVGRWKEGDRFGEGPRPILDPACKRPDSFLEFHPFDAEKKAGIRYDGVDQYLTLPWIDLVCEAVIVEGKPEMFRFAVHEGRSIGIAEN